MSDEEWAAPEYEPSLDEIHDAFAGITNIKGDHGFMRMVPGLERYIWLQEGVYWGHRREHEDGTVEFAWWVT